VQPSEVREAEEPGDQVDRVDFSHDRPQHYGIGTALG
jgi:hypothetical protein